MHGRDQPERVPPGEQVSALTGDLAGQGLVLTMLHVLSAPADCMPLRRPPAAVGCDITLLLRPSASRPSVQTSREALLTRGSLVGGIPRVRLRHGGLQAMQLRVICVRLLAGRQGPRMLLALPLSWCSLWAGCQCRS